MWLVPRLRRLLVVAAAADDDVVADVVDGVQLLLDRQLEYW
jgi:hypothetical protein